MRISFPIILMAKAKLQHIDPVDEIYKLREEEKKLEQQLQELKEKTQPEKEELEVLAEELKQKRDETRDQIVEVLEKLGIAESETFVHDGEVIPGVPKARKATDEEMAAHKKPHENKNKKLEAEVARLTKEIDDVPNQIEALLHPVTKPLEALQEHMTAVEDDMTPEEEEALYNRDLENLRREFREVCQTWLNLMDANKPTEQSEVWRFDDKRRRFVEDRDSALEDSRQDHPNARMRANTLEDKIERRKRQVEEIKADLEQGEEEDE